MSSEHSSLILHVPPAGERSASSSLAIEVATGELVMQRDVEALLLSTNHLLNPKGPAAQAVHLAAGPELASYCRNVAQTLGKETLVVTSAYKLPQRTLLHFLGTVPRRHPLFFDDLSAAYLVILDTCEREQITSIAMQPLGGGVAVRGVWSEAALVSNAVRHAALKHLQRIRFLLDLPTAASRFFQEFRSTSAEAQP